MVHLCLSVILIMTKFMVDANSHTYRPNNNYANDWLYFMLLEAK